MNGKDASQYGGKLSVPDAVQIIIHVLEALDYAHQRNLVHRNVEPSNILVAGSSGAYEAWLTDFGLLKNMDEAGMSGLTRTCQARGLRPFVPPEQIMYSRDVRPQGDIYSAAATLYWLLTKCYVHDLDEELTDPVQYYRLVLDTPPVPIRQRDPSVPESLAQVLEKALAYDPEDRYEEAAEMIHALQQAVS